MKKAISISLLLFANIMVLAHAAIPHHHHNGLAAAVNHHCVENNEHHNHSKECSYGEEPHKHDSEVCALNEIYIPPDNDSKIKCYVDCNCNGTSFILLAWILNEEPLPSDSFELPFRQKPYIEIYHSILSSGTIGLRAPPVC